MPTVRDIANAGLYRLTRFALRLRLTCQHGLRLSARYQPDPFAEQPSLRSPTLRGCYDRFAAFSHFLPPEGPLSVLDIGCNDGFFVFQMAKRRGVCIGVDKDRNAIMVATARAALHNMQNAMFSQVAINKGNVSGLPDVDVVICLSVFHHWVYRLGLDEAKALLGMITSHAKHFLVFETGQPEERETRWASDLAFMGSDSTAWVREFLLGLGFVHVHEAGKFHSPVSSHPRTLFVATRS